MTNITFSEVYTGTHGKGPTGKRPSKHKKNLVDVQAEFSIRGTSYKTIAGRLVQEKDGLWQFVPHSYKITPRKPSANLDTVKAQLSKKVKSICAAEAEHIEIGLYFGREEENRSVAAWHEKMKALGFT